MSSRCRQAPETGSHSRTVPSAPPVGEDVLAELHRVDAADVALQGAQGPAGGGVAHQHAAVLAADGEQFAVGAVRDRLGQPDGCMPKP